MLVWIAHTILQNIIVAAELTTVAIKLLRTMADIIDHESIIALFYRLAISKLVSLRTGGAHTHTSRLNFHGSAPSMYVALLVIRQHSPLFTFQTVNA